MRHRLVRAAIIASSCLLAAGCNTTQLASDTSTTSPENRLLLLASDVEARGDHDTAMALYARAAETSGNSAEAQLRLGNAQLKTKNYAAASATFSKVLATDPNNPEALLGLGTAQLKQGDNEASVRTLGRACPLMNTASACNRHGTALILVGRLDEALAAFDRAQSLAPDDLDIKGNIALVQALSGRADEAVVVMREVAHAPLAKPRHRANLVMVLGLAGRFDEAGAVSVPDMTAAQKRDLLERARRARAAPTPIAKARAVGLLSSV
jgi:Flp pilus assembly protein TadD